MRVLLAVRERGEAAIVDRRTGLVVRVGGGVRGGGRGLRARCTGGRGCGRRRGSGRGHAVVVVVGECVPERVQADDERERGDDHHEDLEERTLPLAGFRLANFCIERDHWLPPWDGCPGSVRRIAISASATRSAARWRSAMSAVVATRITSSQPVSSIAVSRSWSAGADVADASPAMASRGVVAEDAQVAEGVVAHPVGRIGVEPEPERRLEQRPTLASGLGPRRFEPPEALADPVRVGGDVEAGDTVGPAGGAGHRLRAHRRGQHGRPTGLHRRGTDRRRPLRPARRRARRAA